MEEWRDIEGYEGMYQVSNEGRIKSVGRVVMRNINGKIFPVKVRERIMTPQSGVGMYRYIHLHKGNKDKAFRVHKLVWESFNGKVPDGLEIDHIIPVRNGGTDNLENLRVVTRSENHRNPLTVINRKKALKGRFSGELNPRYGVKVSDETKEKIRMKAIGRKYSEEAKKKMSTPVYQCDEDGNIIKEWYGCAEAARYIGTNKCNIAKASKVGRMFKGFRWIRKET
jgi:5-methylcytosine-specific restriction endonuclease McrA